jgi:hypothetical protein
MTFLSNDELSDEIPSTLPRAQREAIEEAAQQYRSTLENDPFAACYLAGMDSDILPSKRRRRLSLERREY